MFNISDFSEKVSSIRKVAKNIYSKEITREEKKKLQNIMRGAFFIFSLAMTQVVVSSLKPPDSSYMETLKDGVIVISSAAGTFLIGERITSKFTSSKSGHKLIKSCRTIKATLHSGVRKEIAENKAIIRRHLRRVK